MSQQHRDQKLHSEAQRSSSLVAQLRAMVAEREAKVRQLELEIGQLSMQVRGHLLRALSPSQAFHLSQLRLPPHPFWLLLTAQNTSLIVSMASCPPHSTHPVLKDPSFFLLHLLPSPLWSHPHGPRGRLEFQPLHSHSKQ